MVTGSEFEKKLLVEVIPPGVTFDDIASFQRLLELVFNTPSQLVRDFLHSIAQKLNILIRHCFNSQESRLTLHHFSGNKQNQINKRQLPTEIHAKEIHSENQHHKHKSKVTNQIVPVCAADNDSMITRYFSKTI